MTQPTSPAAPSTLGSASPPSSAVSTPTASSPTSASSTSLSSTAIDATTRCRYKTGRCSNTRVVKPNGSLLLLCEYHRNQQNRTKKRSDMKYRHHRAKKRQIERQHPQQSRFPPTVSSAHTPQRAPPQPTTTVAATRPHITPPSPPTISTQQALSPIVSTPTMLSSSSGSGKQPLHTPGSVLAKREGSSFSVCKKSALYKISSGLRSAAIVSRISPGKVRAGTLRARSLVGGFGVSRRDIVAMASPHKLGTPTAHRLVPGLPPTPTVGAANTISLVTRTNMTPAQNRVNASSYFHHEPQPPSAMAFSHSSPLCLSPLRHDSPWTARGVGAWQPDDVRLLEYFIL